MSLKKAYWSKVFLVDQQTRGYMVLIYCEGKGWKIG